MNCACPIGNPEPDRPTILLVEPDILLRVLVSEVLREHGFNVAGARNADEALSIVQSGIAINLLVSGAEPLTAAASLPATIRAEYPEIKILLACGSADHNEPSENMDVFLLKPYDVGKLVSLIKSLLGSEQRR